MQILSDPSSASGLVSGVTLPGDHGQLRGSTLSLSDPLIMERVSVQVLIPDRKQCGGEKDTYDDDPAPRGARPEAG